jgi:hypothetical protein
MMMLVIKYSLVNNGTTTKAINSMKMNPQRSSGMGKMAISLA